MTNQLKKIKEEFYKNWHLYDYDQKFGTFTTVGEDVWSFIQKVYSQTKEEGYKEGYNTYIKVASKKTGWKPLWLKDIVAKAKQAGRREATKAVEKCIADPHSTVFSFDSEYPGWKSLAIKTLKEVILSHSIKEKKK